MLALIYSDVFPTGTLDFMCMHLRVIHLGDTILMAAQYFTWADFVVSPEFLFAGSAVNSKHPAILDLLIDAVKSFRITEFD